MKIRSSLSLAVLALAATSMMAAPAFAKRHHQGKKAAMVDKKPMASKEAPMADKKPMSAKATPAPAAATPKK